MGSTLEHNIWTLGSIILCVLDKSKVMADALMLLSDNYFEIN